MPPEIRAAKPIRPQEIGVPGSRLPDQVVDAINSLIEEGFSTGTAQVFEVDILDRLAPEDRDMYHRAFVWVDIWSTYKQAGWEVDRGDTRTGTEPGSPEAKAGKGAYFLFKDPNSKDPNRS